MADSTKMTLPAAEELGSAFSIDVYLPMVLGKRPEGAEVGWFFRGQSDYEWLLQPKIDRPAFVAHRTGRAWTRRHHEERLLNDLQRGARPHVRIQPDGEWEWLAVAQHHGLATRLLDWTSNPLAALHFAVEERKPYVDSAVWCYHHKVIPLEQCPSTLVRYAKSGFRVLSATNCAKS